MEQTETISPNSQTLPWWRRLIASSLLAERALTLSALVVALGFFSSKILGLAREVLIARAFGTSAELDAFRVANTFSDMLDSVVAGATIAAVFIPVFSMSLVRDQAARREGWKFASAVLNDMFLLMTVVVTLGIILAPQLIQYFIAPGFDAAQQALAVDLMRIVLLAAIVFAVGGTITGILHAHNRFALAAMAGPLHNLGIIGAIFFLVPTMGVYGLAWGIVLGSLLYLAIQIPGLIRSGMIWFPVVGRGQKSMNEMLHLLPYRIVTTNVGSLTRLIMNNLASFLGTGSISALSYAYMLWQFPETLIGTAIAVAVFPRLAQRVAAQDKKGFRRLFHITLATILALAIPSAIVTFLFSRQIVALVLERGAFDAASTALVAPVLAYFALAIVGEAVLELTARTFYAQHDARTPMFVTLGAMTLRLALMFWWRDLFGAAGLAFAYAVAVCAEAGALYLLAQRRFLRD
ncbi:murein biosynthesis integral membrane protein MurJ [Anaerolineae bacterium CFX7]|nr:murein biosynthesis integral membrane protein MurJ [Anaerolineae bacterium CFX7]